MIHLKIEGIKFKNSFSMYVLLISPLVFLCFAFFTVLFAKSNTGTANSVSPYITLLFNIWPIAFIPIVLCMACNSLFKIEMRNKSFNYYLSNNWSITKEIRAKIFILSIAFLVHCFLVFIIAYIGDLIINPHPVNAMLLLVTILLMYVVSLPLIPLNFLLTRYFGVFVSILINLVLSVICVLFLTLKSLFWVLPWGIMQRIPLITLGILPNGLVVNHNSKYFNDLNALYISIIVSIIIFAIVTFLNNKKSWRLK
ncbi:TPA: lantibiotic immunity ABC transporter MutE/EpiE family permease subunit [Staphylococcus aureus]